jgi:pimeloyl-ACP methyl ester carboxylesterase
MKRNASLLYTILFSFTALVTPVSDALEIKPPVAASSLPGESCSSDFEGHFFAPPELLDCRNEWCRTLCDHFPTECPGPCWDANCGRLNTYLRDAVKKATANKDVTVLLVEAALNFYVIRRPELPPADYSLIRGNALADLAVSGTAAYATFRELTPNEATLTELVRQRLTESFPTHTQIPSDVSGAIRDVLDRSYRVAWALRGPTPHRRAERGALGWIAISGEDDSPHRPVNVPSGQFPQSNMTVRVSGVTFTTQDVTTRYVVFSKSITDNYPVPAVLNTIPPDRDPPLIVGDIVLFIAGHSSSAEEAELIAKQLLDKAPSSRPVTIIAMDLPSNGYATMIDHEDISPSSTSAWNTGYPILDFIESFIVAFVDGLEAHQPGIKNQIVGVIGGSLGGNMGLRLGRKDPATYPWLQNIVSWSPASCWESWLRANPYLDNRLSPLDPPDHPSQLTEGFGKRASVWGSRKAMAEPEKFDSLHRLFHAKDWGHSNGRAEQAKHWYSESWPCRDAAITSGHRFIYEIYNERFRRWHWRVAHEQVIFSHWDSDMPVIPIEDKFPTPYNIDPAADPDPRKNPALTPDSARYSQIRARMLFASGYNDNNWPEYLFENARNLAQAMTMVNGQALFVMDTAHSIHVERPNWFASQILEFLYQSPPPPFPAFLLPASAF